MKAALVGQPFEIKRFQITVAIECKRCDKHAIVLLTADTLYACPSCDTKFQLVSMNIEGQTVPFQLVGFNIGSTARPGNEAVN